MTCFTKTLLLVGTAALSLTACSGDGKGPGELGSKNDIVVRNNGLPGAQQAAAATDPVDPNSPITSSVENVEPLPPADVTAGEPVPAPEGMAAQEPLPSPDLAVDAAAQKVAEAQAPVPSTTTTPVTDGTPSSTAPTTDTIQADVVAPESIAQQQAQVAPPQQAEPAPQEAVPSSVYPAQAQPVAEPAPTPGAPVPVAQPAAEPAPVATPQPTVAAANINPYDPAMIKAAQGALRAKAGYTGPETGELSSEFLNSLSKYQSENKLAPGGLNVETLRSLGVIE